MTLDTRVQVRGQIDYREVWLKCNQLIGAHEGIKFTDEPVPEWKDGERKSGPEDGEWFIWNDLGQGLCALLDIHYRKDAPLVAPGQHGSYCDGEADGCSEPCGIPCWLEISFDTAYSYRGENDEGCGDLHARLVALLGRWLDSKGIRWSWTNEFTGDTHWGFEGLTELGGGGAKASTWFREIVAPALGIAGAS